MGGCWGAGEGGMREGGMREDGMREGGMREGAMREDGMREDGMREGGMREGGMRGWNERGLGVGWGKMRVDGPGGLSEGFPGGLQWELLVSDLYYPQRCRRD